MFGPIKGETAKLDCAHPLVLNNRATISWASSIMTVNDEATPYVAITKGFRFGKYGDP